MIILSYFILGIAVGTFGTLVGVGGGFFLVPLFIMVLHWTTQQAVGTSLAVVFLNAFSGSLAYIRQNKVFYDAALFFSVATLPGAIIGSYATRLFTGPEFRVTFGVLLICLAALMFFRSSAKQTEGEFNKDRFTYNRVLGICISIIVGFLSSILGIGGGLIHVPAMVYLLSFPIHIATATSHFILTISTFFGVVSHFLLNNIIVKPAVTIGAGAVAGAQIGARLSLKVKSRAVIGLLAIALLGLGARLILTGATF